MLKHTGWVLTGLLILTVLTVGCKIISVDHQEITAQMAIGNSFNVHPPNQTQADTTINTADYWPEGFSGWTISSISLNDLKFSVSGVSSSDLGKSASFGLKFSVLPSTSTQAFGTTDVLTLGEIVANPMSVWNNHVHIDSTGNAKLMLAVQNKQTVKLIGNVISPSSNNMTFSVTDSIKFQITFRKD
jgi:hypothetical protein